MKRTSRPLRCKRCREPAIVELRQHNAGFCQPCFLEYFRRQVGRAVDKEHMFTAEERVLVAVSGGKDSLALWEVLHGLGYDTEGLHLALGIGAYSSGSRQKCEAFAARLGRPLHIVDLAEEGASIPTLTAVTRRPACSACGTAKRHHFDRVAFERGFPVLATGHNLDDEAARLFGNVLRWQVAHLAKQHPVLRPNHERFVRKVKPLFRTTEYETAVYCVLQGIDYVVEECPNSVGATQLLYKDLLNRLEAEAPGSKLSFVQEFLRQAYPRFREETHEPPGTCPRCGMASFDEECGYCRLLAAVHPTGKTTPPPPAS